MFIDNDFPLLLGAELYRPHPAYVAEMVCEPVVVHDFTAQPGQTVQLDRYRFWGSPGTKSDRRRTPQQTIGTSNSRSLIKDKVNVTLEEYTGPADPSDPTAPSTFKISKQVLIQAQRMLLNTANINMFHQSIGSLTLLDDYRRWRDRVFILELGKSEAKGAADNESGGYYFPSGKVKDGSGQISYTASEVSANDNVFDVTTDLLTVVTQLRKRNVPSFKDGYFRCLADPTFMQRLRANDAFREVARYNGNGMINPMLSMNQPNAALYMGGQFGQGGFIAGEPVMPTGFVFEGVRFFDSTNMPETSISTSVDGGSTFNDVTTYQGLFFGPQSVGIGIGGDNAQVLINNNDDFARYIILIWQLYAAFEILNQDFITVAYTY